MSGQASMAVHVNRPPTPGLFAVTPASGLELDTIFTMAASLWYDADLPLQYQFGYASRTGSLAMLQLSQASYTATTLPAGQVASGYAVACQLIVYDSYMAKSSQDANVIITTLLKSKKTIHGLGE